MGVITQYDDVALADGDYFWISKNGKNQCYQVKINNSACDLTCSDYGLADVPKHCLPSSRVIEVKKGGLTCYQCEDAARYNVTTNCYRDGGGGTYYTVTCPSSGPSTIGMSAYLIDGSHSSVGQVVSCRGTEEIVHTNSIDTDVANFNLSGITIVNATGDYDEATNKYLTPLDYRDDDIFYYNNTRYQLNIDNKCVHSSSNPIFDGAEFAHIKFTLSYYNGGLIWDEQGGKWVNDPTWSIDIRDSHGKMLNYDAVVTNPKALVTNINMVTNYDTLAGMRVDCWNMSNQDNGSCQWNNSAGKVALCGGVNHIYDDSCTYTELESCTVRIENDITITAGGKTYTIPKGSSATSAAIECVVPQKTTGGSSGGGSNIGGGGSKPVIDGELPRD